MTDRIDEQMQRIEQKAERLRELCRLSLRLQETTPDVLGTLVAETARILEVEMAMVNLLQQGEIVFKKWHNVPSGITSRRRLPAEASLCRIVIEGNEPLAVRDAMAETKYADLATVKELQVRGYLGVPLKAPRGSVQGSICVMSREPRDFDEADADFLSIVAERAGAEVERESFVQELLQLKEKFERLSIRDELTGVFNRHYLNERLDKEFKRSMRYGSPLSFVMADIDHFKGINDEHGHVFGDLVLKEVSLLIRSAVRDVDIVARYGGEEFAIILPETPGENAVKAASRIQTSISNHSFADDRHPVGLSVSMGVSFLPSEEVSEPQHLIDLVDEALYRAKKQGPNSLVSA